MMIKSNEIRQRAREQLKGSYTVYLLPTAILFAIYATANVLTNVAATGEFAQSHRMLSMLLPLISILLFLFGVNPLFVGISGCFLRGIKQEPNPWDTLQVFRVRYFRTVKNMLFVLIKILCWTLILIVPGILRLLEYAMVPFVLAEHPEMDDEDACEASKALMKGNKWRFCKLVFSFLGWLILAACTFGLGILFLWPYLHAAYSQFYVAVKQEKDKA